jgi:hypothetical protein
MDMYQNDNELSAILMNEYLITVKQEIKTIDFYTIINRSIKEYGLMMKEDQFIYANKKEEEKCCQYELNKVYHENKNIKHIFFILKINILIDADENDQNNYFEKLSLDNPIFRLRNALKNKLQENDDIEKVKIIKDEYNTYYLQKSYPIIHEVENLTRELIYKTMTFLAKKDWEKKEVPDNVQSQIKEDRRNLGIYGTDFSHLSKLLFDRTENSNINQIVSKLERLSECNKNDLNELKSKIPKSNWQKYFSKINIEENIKNIKEELYKDETFTDSEVIKQLFKDLNDIRNKVAHNNIEIDDNFYDILDKKSLHLKTWIKNAINYIENETNNNSKQRTLQKMSKNEKKLYKSIQELIEKIANFYKINDINDNKIKSYLDNNFCETEFDDDGIEYRKSKDKCINDIIFFIKLKTKIANEIKLIDDTERAKHIEDINQLINDIDKCPKKNEIKNDFSRRRVQELF